MSEFNESEIKPNKIALRVSLLYTLYSVLLTYIMFFMGIDMNGKVDGLTKVFVYLLSYGPFFGIIFYAQRYHRDEQLNGYVSFGRAFSTGLRVALFSGLFLGIFMVLYYKVLNVTAFEKVIEQAQETLADSGKMEDDQIESAMSITKKMFIPMIMIGTVLGMAIFGCVFSLIGSFINKRERPFFVSAPEE